MQLYKILSYKCPGKYAILTLESLDGQELEKSWKAGEITDLYHQNDELYEFVMNRGLVGMFVGVETVSSGRMNYERIKMLIAGPVAWRKEDVSSS